MQNYPLSIEWNANVMIYGTVQAPISTKNKTKSIDFYILFKSNEMKKDTNMKKNRCLSFIEMIGLE